MTYIPDTPNLSFVCLFEMDPALKDFIDEWHEDNDYEDEDEDPPNYTIKVAEGKCDIRSNGEHDNLDVVIRLLEAVTAESQYLGSVPISEILFSYESDAGGGTVKTWHDRINVIQTTVNHQKRPRLIGKQPNS